MPKTLLAILVMAVMAVATIGIAGCGNDNGPAEKAGQKIDKMTGQEGPAQKAGEKMDQAGQNTADAVKDATGNNDD